jgi:hypothetical protein
MKEESLGKARQGKDWRWNKVLPQD